MQEIPLSLGNFYSLLTVLKEVPAIPGNCCDDTQLVEDGGGNVERKKTLVKQHRNVSNAVKTFDFVIQREGEGCYVNSLL